VKLELIETCSACPEQYDVKTAPSGDVVGYIRLRFGRLTVVCPDHGGQLVYSKRYEDSWMGSFFTDRERRKQLKKAKKAIKRWLGERDG